MYDKAMWWRTALALAAALTLSACSTVPRGPSVMVLPGAGKSLEQFQLDDAACRQWAAQQLGATSGDSWMMQRSYDIAYQQCMYSRDNQIPGASAPQRVPTPPPPPGAPPSPPPPPGR
jgi:hypothetical protein